MRLTPEEIATIRHAARIHFGQDAKVWLFGSRVDDAKRGGDIDLYVETDLHHPTDLLKREINLKLELDERLGEQKIDIVVRPRTSELALPIHRVARETGIEL